MLLPFVVSAVALLVEARTDYYAVGDVALTELRTDDVVRHPVLTGPYSRDGWNHPGPALFYTLFVPYWLVGSHAVGLALGALLINGIAVAGMVILAHRHGGLPVALLTATGCALLVRALGPDLVRDAWNPYVTVLPFALLVYLTWSMTCGDAWAMPVSAGVASFCIQTHIGYLLLAAPLLVWGASGMVLSWRHRPGRPRHIVRAAAITSVVLVVLWLPPLIEQVISSPGNLGEVSDYFRDGEGETHSLTEGYRAVLGQFGLPPQWLTGDVDVTPYTGESDIVDSAPTPVLLVPFAVAIVVLWRRRRSDALRLATTLAFTLAFGILTVAQIIGPAYPYRLRWTWALGTIGFVLTAWAGWVLAEKARRQAVTRALAVTASGAAIALALVNSVSAARAGVPYEGQSSVLHALVPPVQAALPEGDGQVIVRGRGLAESEWMSGLVVLLERAGVAARVDRKYEDSFGTHRAHDDDDPVRAVLILAVDGHFDKRFRSGSRLIAYSGTRSPAQRQRIAERVAELEAARDAGEIDPLEFLKRVGALDTGSAVGVFMEVPPARSSGQ